MPLDTIKTVQKQVFDAGDMEFARHDPLLCRMPGLFRFVEAGIRDKTKISVELKHVHGISAEMAAAETARLAKAVQGEPLAQDELKRIQRAAEVLKAAKARSITLHASGPMLNGIHLAVLQGIISLCAVGARTIDADSTDQDGLALREKMLAREGVLLQKDTPAVAPDTLSRASFSTSELLQTIGLSVCGANRDLVDAAIMELAKVSLFLFPTFARKKFQRYMLIAEIESSEMANKHRKTMIALNPRLSRIVLGTEKHYTHVDLNEARALGTDQAARILHQRLCTLVNDGKSRPLTYRSLMKYLFPQDDAAISLEGARKEHFSGYSALAEEDREKARLEIMRKASNKLEERLSGWYLTPAYRIPFNTDPAASIETNLKAAKDHKKYQLKHKKLASKDIMDTLVWIHRGKLSTFSYADVANKVQLEDLAEQE